MSATAWLHIARNNAPLIVSLPHAGTEIPAPFADDLASPWLALKDTDWWIDQLYDAAPSLGATVIRTAISRTVIDVNRDPSGVSLYPGQATTELCPSMTFDGEPLYREGHGPAGVAGRRGKYFDPYHAALAAEIARLREKHAAIVVYDCHSIRSAIPRLFSGTLPQFSIGTNSGASCARELSEAIAALCKSTGREPVVDVRFKGGFVTRSCGAPARGVHAVQMELACRAYLREPAQVEEASWPPPYDPAFAAPLRATLIQILATCRDFAFAQTGAKP